MICEDTDCHSKHSYKCAENICSINKKECDDYIDFAHYTSMVAKDNKYNHVFLRQNTYVDKFKLFHKKIQICAEKIHILQPNDFCKNAFNCLHRQEVFSKLSTFRFRSSKKYTLKKIDCPCRGNFSYHCGKEFCAVHKTACDLAQKKESYFKINRFTNEVKSCFGKKN